MLPSSLTSGSLAAAANTDHVAALSAAASYRLHKITLAIAGNLVNILFSPWNSTLKFMKSLNWMAERIASTPTKIVERICISPTSKDKTWLLRIKVITNKHFKRTLRISGGHKSPRLVWILNWSPKRRYQWRRLIFDKRFVPKLRTQKPETTALKFL